MGSTSTIARPRRRRKKARSRATGKARKLTGRSGLRRRTGSQQSLFARACLTSCLRSRWLTLEPLSNSSRRSAWAGAACSIHPEALPMFRGKRVRIYGHADEAGQCAIQRWAEQLEGVQAEVDGFFFDGLLKRDGSPVNDMNDFLAADHRASGCGIEVITGATDFALEKEEVRSERGITSQQNHKAREHAKYFRLLKRFKQRERPGIMALCHRLTESKARTKRSLY